MRCTVVTCAFFLILPLIPLRSAELTPAARQAFERYIELFESRWKGGVRAPIGEKPKIRQGEVVITDPKTLDVGKEIKAPGAMIQDWLGAIFLPNTSLHQVRSIMQDYNHYAVYFKPEVTESRLLSHRGDGFEVFLRLYKKHVLTVVLNTNYSIQYGEPDASHMYIISRSTRVAEVSDAKQSLTKEEPLGNDSGYLWALNSYWRFEEGAGGVFAECEAVSLSRDVPFGLGWAIKGFLNKFPQESMENTLAGLKRAVANSR